VYLIREKKKENPHSFRIIKVYKPSFHYICLVSVCRVKPLFSVIEKFKPPLPFLNTVKEKQTYVDFSKMMILALSNV